MLKIPKTYKQKVRCGPNMPFLHDPEPDELARFRKHHVDSMR